MPPRVPNGAPSTCAICDAMPRHLVDRRVRASRRDRRPRAGSPAPPRAGSPPSASADIDCTSAMLSKLWLIVSGGRNAATSMSSDSMSRIDARVLGAVQPLEGPAARIRARLGGRVELRFERGRERRRAPPRADARARPAASSRRAACGPSSRRPRRADPPSTDRRFRGRGPLWRDRRRGTRGSTARSRPCRRREARGARRGVRGARREVRGARGKARARRPQRPPPAAPWTWRSPPRRQQSRAERLTISAYSEGSPGGARVPGSAPESIRSSRL